MAGEPSEPVIRTTAVLLARDGEVRFFKDPTEVPAELRREMEAAFNGRLTATIVLADEAGQRYLQARRTAALAKPQPRIQRLSRTKVRQIVIETASATLLAIAIWMLAALR